MGVPTSQEAAGALSERYSQITKQGTSIKRSTENIRAACLAGPIVADRLIGLMDDLKIASDKYSLAPGIPGLNDYAKIQTDDPTYDLLAEIVLTQVAILPVNTWINDNVPKDGIWISTQQIVDFKVVDRTIPTAGTLALVVLLDDLLATIGL